LVVTWLHILPLLPLAYSPPLSPACLQARPPTSGRWDRARRRHRHHRQLPAPGYYQQAQQLGEASYTERGGAIHLQGVVCHVLCKHCNHCESDSIVSWAKHRGQ